MKFKTSLDGSLITKPGTLLLELIRYAAGPGKLSSGFLLSSIPFLLFCFY
jgi:hypothetical protein